MTSNRVTLAELKAKSPKDLLSMAEELEIENASTMRKGDMMFSILKERAEDGAEISGDGVLKCFKTVLVSCGHPRQIICRVQTIFMFHRK